MNISPDKLTGFPPSRRWNAHWIWPTDTDPQKPNTFVLLRKTFSLDNSAAHIFISADTRYQLYINGCFVNRGQPLSQPYFQYYNEHDLSEFLKPGLNCIGVIVYHLGVIPYSRGGLLAEIVDPQNKTLLATDASWRAQVASAWNPNTYRYAMNVNAPYQEQFDSRKFPHDFATPAFDDSRWNSTTIVSSFGQNQPPAAGPWSQLLPRDIPYLPETPVHAQHITLAGESLGLICRPRLDDLSITLSQPANPLRYATIQSPENLLNPTAPPAVIQCSTNHLRDVAFDGIYEPSILLDFGKIITATVKLDLEGPAGAIVDIGYAERLIDGYFNNAIEGIFADRCILREGRQTYSPFHWRAFRYLRLRFHDAFTPLKIHCASANITTYPYEDRGHFQSSDETLNRIFEISRYTLRLCSHEAFFDTPWRETAQWLGDVAAVTVPAVYACFGDTALAGKYFRQAAMNQYPVGLIANITNGSKPISNMNATIPDYSLWWIMGLWNHYLYTGESRWIDNFYPHALRILQAHLPNINDRGLIETMPWWVFLDWADLDKKGESAAYNAIFYGALESLLHMAELRGDQYTITQIRNIRTALKANFTSRFFDSTRGLLADARQAETLSPKTSEQSNFAAINFGLLETDLANRIVDRLFAHPQPQNVIEAQPPFMLVVLRALQKLNRMDLALQLIRDRWGRMLAQGATSTFEEWTINGSRRDGTFQPFMRSCSHAWSACPAEFLIRNLLGLEILTPSCTTLRLAPTPTPFDYDITYPTPQGPVRVTHTAGKFTRHIPSNIKSESP